MKKFNELPAEIQERMLQEQERQGNTRNVEVFEKNIGADDSQGGFLWGDSEEGFYFWDRVLLNDNLAAFYGRYPKARNNN